MSEVTDESQRRSDRESTARTRLRPLLAPSTEEAVDQSLRLRWIEETCAAFVSPSKANRSYYRVILETLWPEGHGLPGPQIREPDLRQAIDDLRKRQGDPSVAIKPYYDPFRRVRELLGEEGITGITKVGSVYQLLDTSTSPKRLPRKGYNKSVWSEISEMYDNRCAVCNCHSSTMKFQLDHRIPRLRGGSDELSNLQPLCKECNNFKSASCRGCGLDCRSCPWAFPAENPRLTVSGDDTSALRSMAAEFGVDLSDLLARALSYVDWEAVRETLTQSADASETLD